MKNENNEYRRGIDSIINERPAKILWVIPSLIGALIVIIIAWLTISQVDVIAPSLGKTIPSSRMILIQPKEISTIEKIYVKNGQKVKKGDLLVKFKSKIESFENIGIKAKYENLVVDKLFLENYIEFLDAQKNIKTIVSSDIPLDVMKRLNLKLESNVSSYKNEKYSLKIKVEKVAFEMKMLDTDVSKKMKIILFTKENLKNIMLLVDRGLEARITLQDTKKEFIEQENDIKIKKEEISKLKAQYRITKQELKQFKNNAIKESIQKLTEVSNELNTLAPEVKKSNYSLELKSVISPISGIIYNLRNHTVGEVVQSGKIIMELIPQNTPLEVEAKVLNRDIGFVKIGQKVKVKLDSFKFTKYGYIEGVISNIEKASILDETLGEIYPIIVELAKDEMNIDNKIVKLIPGMTATVDIKIGKRRLIEYIISPMVRYKDEALREK